MSVIVPVLALISDRSLSSAMMSAWRSPHRDSESQKKLLIEQAKQCCAIFVILYMGYYRVPAREVS